MPIDPNIYGGGGQAVQPIDPMRTLAQVSTMQNMQLQRQEAQQRIAINQAAEQRLSQTAALEDEKRTRGLQTQKVLQDGFKNSTTPEGEIDINKLTKWLIDNDEGAAVPGIQKTLLEAQTAISQFQQSGGKNELAARNALGAMAASVDQMAPEHKIAGVQSSLAFMQGFGVLTPNQATDYLNRIRDSPEDLPEMLAAAIKASPEQQDKLNAAPRPQSVSPENDLVLTQPDGTTKTIRKGTGKVPDPGTFGARLYEYAQTNNIVDKDGNPQPLKIPGAVQDQLREQWATHDPTTMAIRELTLKNLKEQGHSPGEIAAFSHIVDLKERSPLVKAADRTLILKDAADKIEADPTNGAAQLNLLYGYVQALDTYQSSVREGELQNVGVLGTKWENLKVTVNRYIDNGQVVPPEVAKKIAATSKEMISVIEKGRQNKMAEFGRQADTVGVGDMWKKYTTVPGASTGKIKARDPQGKLHEADAGTPLPAGWTQVQ